MDMELFEELERIKIRFVAAYDKLVKQGVISERDYQEILEMLKTHFEAQLDWRFVLWDWFRQPGPRSAAYGLI
jgi:hypothetical protein